MRKKEEQRRKKSHISLIAGWERRGRGRGKKKRGREERSISSCTLKVCYKTPHKLWCLGICGKTALSFLKIADLVVRK